MLSNNKIHNFFNKYIFVCECSWFINGVTGFKPCQQKSVFSQTHSLLLKLILSSTKLWVHCFSMTQRSEEYWVFVCAMLVVCVSQRGLLITTPTLLGTCACQMVPVALSLKHRWCRWIWYQNKIIDRSWKMEKGGEDVQRMRGTS